MSIRSLISSVSFFSCTSILFSNRKLSRTAATTTGRIRRIDLGIPLIIIIKNATAISHFIDYSIGGDQTQQGDSSKQHRLSGRPSMYGSCMVWGDPNIVHRWSGGTKFDADYLRPDTPTYQVKPHLGIGGRSLNIPWIRRVTNRCWPTGSLR